MPTDMTKYLGLFVSEAQDHLEALSRELVRLEKEKSRESIDSLFRHAHSVKGMAASMGFEQIATIAHRVEDLVDRVRTNPETLTADLADMLFAASDQMQSLVKAVAAGQSANTNEARLIIDRLGEHLRSLTGEIPPPERIRDAAVHAPTADFAVETALPPVTQEDQPSPNPPDRGESSPVTPVTLITRITPTALAARRTPRFIVTVKIAGACVVPGVRAFLVHRKLSTLGNIINVTPSVDDLKAGRVADRQVVLEIDLADENGDQAIKKVLATVADLESVNVELVDSFSRPVASKAKSVAEPHHLVGLEPARTVRVKTESLDYFLDIAGELLLVTAHLRELARAIPDTYRGPLDQGVDRLRGLVKDLHGKVMSVRMTPLSLITDRLPRAARDLARKKGIEVDLAINGTDIELDRAILDELSDPLLHLLRNCIDHGLEQADERLKSNKGARGRITLSARRDREWVVLDLEDDGRGMNVELLKNAASARGLITEETARTMNDREALLLCCLPGVSTATQVTDVSGRGVGMDAVKRAVENAGGTLEIESTPEKGTRFTLRVPLTVAVVNVLLVGVGDEVFGLPIAKVKTVIQANPDQLSKSRNAPVLSLDGALVPVHPLGEILQIRRLAPGGPRPHIVLDTDMDQIALEVDSLLGHEEAVLKPLSHPLNLVSGLAGVTILGSGRPIFILDVPRLVA